MAFAPNYAGSPLIGGPGSPGAKGNHSHTARPGHHLSPRDLPDGANSYDHLGAGFTLFVEDGARGTDLAAQAQQMGVPLSVVPISKGGVQAAYDTDAVLVRPDHFVAWVEDGADAGAVLARATGRGA